MWRLPRFDRGSLIILLPKCSECSSDHNEGSDCDQEISNRPRNENAVDAHKTGQDKQKQNQY